MATEAPAVEPTVPNTDQVTYERVSEDEKQSDRYKCKIPAFAYNGVKAVKAETADDFLKVALELTGGNFQNAADMLAKSYNSEARKAASGVDEFFKMAITYRDALPSGHKHKNANPFKLAAIFRKGEFASGS